MAHMWGDVERGMETRREEMDRQRIAKLEKENAEKDQKIESLEKNTEKMRRELQEMQKLEEDIIRERSKSTALEAKMRRSEARAESVEAELSMQETAVAELSNLRNKLRSMEQQTSYIKEQMQIEALKASEKENLANTAQQRLQEQATEKAHVERNLAAARREADTAKAEAMKLKASLEGVSSRTDLLLQSATTDAEELRSRAKDLENRVCQYDVIQRSFEEADEDRETANSRARELARLLAVEKTQKGTLESLVNHQNKVIYDMKKELGDLKEAARILATEQEQSNLSLLMVRTGYSDSQGNGLDAVKKQYLLEKREHHLLKMEHEKAVIELNALKTGMTVKKEFEKMQEALKSVPSPLEPKYKTPAPPKPQQVTPVWDFAETTQQVTHIQQTVEVERPVEKLLRSPPPASHPSFEGVLKVKDPAHPAAPKNLHSFLHPNTGGLKGKGWPVVTPPPTVRLTPQGQVSQGGVSNDEISSTASSADGWKKWSDPNKDAKDKDSQKSHSPAVSRLDAERNVFETSSIGWVLERPSS